MRAGAEHTTEESLGCAGEQSLMKLHQGAGGTALIGPARATVGEGSTDYSGNLRYVDKICGKKCTFNVSSAFVSHTQCLYSRH